MERSAWLLLARGPLREMAERRPLLLLLQLDAPRMLRPMKRAWSDIYQCGRVRARANQNKASDMF